MGARERERETDECQSCTNANSRGLVEGIGLIITTGPFHDMKNEINKEARPGAPHHLEVAIIDL